MDSSNRLLLPGLGVFPGLEVACPFLLEVPEWSSRNSSNLLVRARWSGARSQQWGADSKPHVADSKPYVQIPSLMLQIQGLMYTDSKPNVAYSKPYVAFTSHSTFPYHLSYQGGILARTLQESCHKALNSQAWSKNQTIFSWFYIAKVNSNFYFN